MLMFRPAAVAAMSVLANGPAQSQPAGIQVQVINLASYSYAPAPIVLRAGRPVTLRFVNRSKNGHDFTAAKFFSSARILSGHVASGEVDLRPGQLASVTLIPAAGRYNVHCSHAFHKVLGMKTTILVQ